MATDISLIIPSFNRVDLLRLTLSSAGKAIHNLNAEIILVDDGSEPPLKPQLIEFDHLPIKFIRQNNSGLTTSRYNGLLQASGEFIQFLDSDDQITADKLLNQVCEMQKQNADVSHTDVLQAKLDKQNQIIPLNATIYKDVENPAEFYITVQPPPHSPVFRRDYLIKYLSNPFIPLSRAYDSIGEVWFYYNLSPYPAKIIKIEKPLTIIIHHDEGRLTNHWERLGLCALSLMKSFVKSRPVGEIFSEDAKRLIGKAAFNTFRGLPFNIYKPFQKEFLNVWRLLGRTKDVGGGNKFTWLAKIIGYPQAAVLLKYLANNNYRNIRTIEDGELVDKTTEILKIS